MSAQRLEAFLARVYVDDTARAKFRSDPAGEARRAGLTDEQARSLQEIDWEGLELAARSFARKRQRAKRRG